VRKMVKLTLIQGDALKILPRIPDESVDLVVTDPPYNISQESKRLTRSNLLSSMHKRQADILLDFGEWDRKSEEKYKKFTEQWFLECKRVMKQKAWFFSFFSKERIGFFTDPINGFFVKNGFKTRTVITWCKTNPVPSFRKMNFLSATEFIVVGSKGKAKITNFLEQKNMKNYFMTPNSSVWQETQHPTEKPITLIKWIIRICSNENDTILDPFLGSGTTMKACLELKRNCIGIEINPEYINITKKRLNWGYSLGDIQFEFYTEDEFKEVFEDEIKSR